MSTTTAARPTRDPHPSPHARKVLELLRDHHNVVLVGPPGTGKATLLAGIRHLFEVMPVVSPGDPEYVEEEVPYPQDAPTAPPEWMPSPSRPDHRVFSAVFDQSTTYRDFMRGVTARVDRPASGVALRVTEGTLYRANEHARQADGASLLTVDETNRGPAVKSCGSTIAVIEADKRLGPGGMRVPGKTLEFEVFDHHGCQQPYALAQDLYLFAPCLRP